MIWPGKTKNSQLRALIEDYQQRISHFSRCDITELRETRSREDDVGIDRQTKRITDALLNADVTVLLDPQGQEWSSEQLARQVQNWENRGVRTVAFVVGGPDGVSEGLKKQVDKLWSLSKLTFTHEMARVMLLEQLYRSFAIIHRLPYVR
jgi:23S rRNA (pseudouridine1915-N3)-methyltransferase